MWAARKEKISRRVNQRTHAGREIQSESAYKMALIDHRFSPDGPQRPPTDSQSNGPARPPRSDAAAAQVAGGAGVFSEHPALAAVTTREVGVVCRRLGRLGVAPRLLEAV